GGEPMVRPDIFDIVSFFRDNRIKTGIATNGTLLNEKNINRLVKSGIGYFEISLPSVNQKIYSTLSQNDKTEKIRSAILLIKKYRIHLTVSFILTKINLNELESVIDLCYVFSADSIALNRFVPGGYGLKNKNRLDITQKELESALKIADQKSAEYHIPINITIPIESCIIDRNKYPHLNFSACVCGKYKWVIDPLGNLRTCEQNPEIIGNLFKDSFIELSSRKQAIDFLANYVYKRCNKCPNLAFCGGGCKFLKCNR
ncbi:MAG: radical SAM protein, partial [Candidatus Gracilibacteria bacterium]